MKFIINFFNLPLICYIIRLGNFGIFRYIMECTNIDVNCPKKGIILSFAIQSHRIEMFKILLEKSQHDINEKYISIFFF